MQLFGFFFFFLIRHTLSGSWAQNLTIHLAFTREGEVPFELEFVGQMQVLILEIIFASSEMLRFTSQD